MYSFTIESDMGFRVWLADDAEHAIEQHKDAFPEEKLISVNPTFSDWERHPVFVNDEGIIPHCDICHGPQRTEGDDWNGETGNHFSCEELEKSFDVSDGN